MRFELVDMLLNRVSVATGPAGNDDLVNINLSVLNAGLLSTFELELGHFGV